MYYSIIFPIFSNMELKEIYAVLKEIEDQVEETCCAITMDPLDIKDLIIKLRKLINEYAKNK